MDVQVTEVPPKPVEREVKSVTLTLTSDEAVYVAVILGRANESVFGIRSRIYRRLADALDIGYSRGDKFALSALHRQFSAIAYELLPDCCIGAARAKAQELNVA